MTRRLLIAALALSGVTRLPAADPTNAVTALVPAQQAVAPAPVAPALLQAAKSRIEAELLQDILPFWMQNTRDRSRGGFFGEISSGMKVRTNAPRGPLLTARILWTFSAAYRRYHDPACLEMAKWAYDDLVSRCWDATYGGLFWTIGADGKPLDMRKSVYVQAFGIYGLSEYSRATGDSAALNRAIELYRLIEARSRDRANGGYHEEFARNWSALSRAEQGIMGPAGTKSQNVHLHILEAYTSLLRVWPDPQLREDLTSLVGVMMTRVLNPASHHLRLFFKDDWTPQTDAVSYGHDIEFSWLLPEAAAVLDDPGLVARTNAVAVEIARTTLSEGIDTDGGVAEEGGPAGITDRSKEWWPQAEAAIGLLNAYQISGDPVFLNASLRLWDFIDTRLIDRKNGEWLQGLTRYGKPSRQPKVSFWKCPYHNGRACMEIVERLDSILSRSQATAGAPTAPRR